MDYKKRMALIELQKEKLALRLERIAKKERALKANVKKAERDEIAKRKYRLGGLVFTALSKCNISDFEDSEILGALIKSFEANSKVHRLAFLRSGESVLIENRQENIQSAHAQGFTESEIKTEAVGAVSNE